MLKVITDQAEIKKHIRQFAKKFKPFIDEKIKVKLGHQGASFPAKVLWSKRLGMWLFAHAIKDVRYWNAFGTVKPEPDELVSITAEINFPWSGVDRKTGGTFARDFWGNVFVIHRGKIGGGKKGVGKSLFEHNYRGVWTFMEDGDGISQVAVIGALQSPRIALQIASFVKKIELLKIAAVQSSQTQIIFPEIPFREDLVGNLPLTDRPSLTALCDHDLIISELAALLKRWKFRVGNDENHELFCVDPSSNMISHIFAVVTGNKEKSIMAAAAKLLLQTKSNGGVPLPILILPEEKIPAYALMLQKIGIVAIGFRVEEERITFPDLGKIRLDQNQQLRKE